MSLSSELARYCSDRIRLSVFLSGVFFQFEPGGVLFLTSECKVCLAEWMRYDCNDALSKCK